MAKDGAAVKENPYGPDSEVKPSVNGCEVVEDRQHVVHLWMCLECGHVGCCDSSLHKHATKHFHKTEHDVGSILSRVRAAGVHIDEMEVDVV